LGDRLFEKWYFSKQWVVESYYLYPEGEEPEVTTNIFQIANKDEGEYQPFRFLGRHQTIPSQ